MIVITKNDITFSELEFLEYKNGLKGKYFAWMPGCKLRGGPQICPVNMKSCETCERRENVLLGRLQSGFAISENDQAFLKVMKEIHDAENKS